MRRRRPVPESGTVPLKTDQDESLTTLQVLERTGTPHGAKGDPAVDQHLAGSLELMFDEISGAGRADEQGPVSSGPVGRYDELWQLSLADPLTGLANRMLLLDRLTRELTRRQRHGGCVIVSHIDLGNLKDINDELGYSSGNEVLRGMSQRLTAMLRSEDTVSRVGESELVAVMTIENEEFLGPLMQRVKAVLDNPIAVTGRNVRVAATFGTVTARNSESAEEVLARAGHAA